MSSVSTIVDPIVIDALDVIQQRAREPTLTRAAVAADVGVAESTLAHHFKRAVGRSVTEQIARARVGIVEAGLLEGSKTIGTLAAEAGFASLSVCDHWFRRVHGAPPLQWQLQHRPPSRQTSR